MTSSSLDGESASATAPAERSSLAGASRGEGTTVEVNSQGEAETQPVNTTSSLFGDHVEHPTVAETLLEQTGATCNESYMDQPVVAEENLEQTEAADNKGLQPKLLRSVPTGGPPRTQKYSRCSGTRGGTCRKWKCQVQRSAPLTTALQPCQSGGD